MIKLSSYLLVSSLCFILAFGEGCKSKKNIQETEETTIVVEENPLEKLLSGLQLLGPMELNGRQVTIDGISMPVYDANGEVLSGESIVTFFRDENMVFDIYGNDKLEPMAVVFREKTAEDMTGNNEEGTPLPPMETVLEYAPSFIANDMQGNEVNLESLKGKVVLINFWFTRCQPCIEEIPELNGLVEKYKDNPDVVFLAITHNGKELVDDFLNSHPFDYIVIPDAQSIVDDYIVMGFPTNMVLDKLGDIQYHSMGYRHKIDNILDKEIRKALK